MTCPKCEDGDLKLQYGHNVVDAVRGEWTRRLTCMNPACGARGYIEPTTKQWIFFDELQPHKNHGRSRGRHRRQAHGHRRNRNGQKRR